MDRHQGEATVSQLGWHPAKPPSYTANFRENFIKKRGKSTREGTRPKPSKNKEKTTKKRKEKRNSKQKKKKKRKHLTTGTESEGTHSDPKRSQSEESEATPRTKVCFVSNDPY